MDYTNISSRIYQNKYGIVSIEYKGNRQTHDPIKRNNLSYLPQKDQDTINMLFDTFGRERFTEEQTARDTQNLIDNPIPIPLTAQEKFDRMDERMKAVVKTVAQLTNTPLQDAIDIVKSHMD